MNILTKPIPNNKSEVLLTESLLSKLSFVKSWINYSQEASMKVSISVISITRFFVKSKLCLKRRPLKRYKLISMGT